MGFEAGQTRSLTLTHYRGPDQQKLPCLSMLSLVNENGLFGRHSCGGWRFVYTNRQVRKCFGEAGKEKALTGRICWRPEGIANGCLHSSCSGLAGK